MHPIYLFSYFKKQGIGLFARTPEKIPFLYNYYPLHWMDRCKFKFLFHLQFEKKAKIGSLKRCLFMLCIIIDFKFHKKFKASNKLSNKCIDGTKCVRPSVWKLSHNRTHYFKFVSNIIQMISIQYNLNNNQ